MLSPRQYILPSIFFFTALYLSVSPTVTVPLIFLVIFNAYSSFKNGTP